MEPISPNLAALPGTVLESFGPSAMEVGQARLGDEMKMVAAAQKAKIEERAAAAKAARDAMKLPDFGTVGIPHEQQYAQLINEYLDFGAQAERMAATNPGNPEYDVSSPFSTVGRQKAAKEYQIKQAAAMSEEKGKAYYQFLKDFETGKYTNKDMEAMKEWYERPLVFGQDNSVTYDPMPTLLGAFDKMAFLASNFDKLKADKLARASAGGGYIDESTVTQLTPEDVEAGAISMAAPGQRNQLVTQYTYELEEMQKSNPKAYQELEAAAKKKGITPIQEQAARDSRIFAYKQQEASKKSDPTFTSGMGTGWMKNEEGVDKFIKTGSSIVKNDPEIMKPMDMRTANVPEFVARVIPPDGKVTFTNQYNGILLTPSADKLPIVINGVYKYGNMIYVDRRVAGQEGQTRTTYPGKDQSMMAPGQALPVLQFTEEEFLGAMFEEVAAGNKDLDRETLNRRAKAMNMMQESGNIDPYRGANPFDAEIEAGKKSSAPQKPKF